MSRALPSEVIQELRERLRRLERSLRPTQEPVLATSLALDHLLPGRGLEWGTLIEWLSDGEGTGAATLALAVTAALLHRGGAVVVIDSGREFYPPAAANWGIPLEQTVVVQPNNVRDALWAWEQSLRCPAVDVALGWLERLNDRAFRRLQLAAETGGALGFLLRPLACRAEPSWAAQRLLVQALPAGGGLRFANPNAKPAAALERRLHLELLHRRGGASGEAVELELNDETGHVRLVSRLADPAPAARAAGA